MDHIQLTHLPYCLKFRILSKGRGGGGPEIFPTNLRLNRLKTFLRTAL
jgi:hypothetical protein